MKPPEIAPTGAGLRPARASRVSRNHSSQSPRVFIHHDTLDYFEMRLRRPKFVAFAVELHRRQVNALRAGSPVIEGTVEQIGADAKVSKRTSWDAWKCIRDLGWGQSPRPGVILFDYRTKPSMNAGFVALGPAKNADRINGIDKPSGRDVTAHPTATVPTVALAEPPAGGDGPLGGPEGQKKVKPPSVFSEAVTAMVAAGADRAGAVAAVKSAAKAGRLELGTIQRIAQAVAAMPSKPFRPGGLICAAVKRPELGQKILREASSGKCETTHDAPRPSGRGKTATGDAGLALGQWERLKASRPRDGSAGYLAHLDLERKAKAAAVIVLESTIANLDARKSDLERRLEASGMKRGSLVWRRAWDHQWGAFVMELACVI